MDKVSATWISSKKPKKSDQSRCLATNVQDVWERDWVSVSPKEQFFEGRVSIFLVLIIIFFLQYSDLNSRFTFARQALYHFSHASSHFALVIVEMGVAFCLGWPGPRTSYFKLPSVTGMTQACHLAQLFPLRWDLTNFLPWCWPGTVSSWS
jgi:hypothetical protein